MKMTTISKSLFPFYAKKFGMEMDEPHPYKLCKLRDSNGDLSKTWYVEYYAYDVLAEKLQRKRVVVEHKTAKERYDFAKDTIKKIDTLLKNGAVLNKSKLPKKQRAILQIKSTSTVLDAIEFFINFKRSIVTKETLGNYNTDFNRFKKFLEVKKIEAVTVKDFTDMKALAFFDYLVTETKLSNRSRNNTTDTLAGLFNFYKERKIIEKNPFEDINDLPAPARKHAAFTNRQAKEMMAEAKKEQYGQLHLFLSFLYYAFLRPNKEIRLLKVHDIKGDTIRINATNAKDDTAEHVMIPPPLKKLIAENRIMEYPDNFYVFSKDGKPGTEVIHKKYMYYRHRIILEKFGIHNDEYDVYGWKHTGVIALWQATQNMELIRQQCRHEDISTTQNYLRDLGIFVDYDQINKFPEL